MRVVDRIHRDPADVKGRLAERLIREPLLAGLREGLVSTARARDRADRGPAVRMERVELSGGQLDDRSLGLADDDGLRPRGADELPSVPGHRFHVVDERSFRDVAEGQRVPSVHVRHAVCDRLADRETVTRDHEDFLAVEADARERRGVTGSLEDVRDDAGPAKVRMDDGTGMAVARRPVRWRGAAAAPLGSQILPQSEHPDPHPDLFRGKARLQLDDRVFAILAHERVDLLDFHLEEVLERFLDLVPRRLSADEELEAIAVFQILRRRPLEHVHRLLCDVRMEEDLVGLHGGQLLSTSSAPSLKTVSRPGSPPGARTSAFNAAGLTTSTPGRFPRRRRTVRASLTTTRTLRGCRYRRPRIFPRPARMCRPSFARSTSCTRPS